MCESTEGITKEELLKILQEPVKYEDGEIDTETTHKNADEALLDFINDEEIREAFVAVDKWYS
jgi:hypothetical protein